jgi:hypothetical protein
VPAVGCLTQTWSSMLQLANTDTHEQFPDCVLNSFDSCASYLAYKMKELLSYPSQCDRPVLLKQPRCCFCALHIPWIAFCLCGYSSLPSGFILRNILSHRDLGSSAIQSRELARAFGLYFAQYKASQRLGQLCNSV